MNYFAASRRRINPNEIKANYRIKTYRNEDFSYLYFRNGKQKRTNIL